ncbi:MAG: efflux RND transporter periplasmic adaptor subunit [Desulfuromonadales bacterium]|nr:efflux RND transporter periplasmic adaptor subunit [Desulfuromonadales bacterium]
MTPLRPLLPLLLAGLLLCAGCDPPPPAAPPRAADKATPVLVETVKLRDLDEQIVLPGSLEAWEDLTLAAELTGPVDWVGPEEGERLQAGQAILTIDAVSQRANLTRAEIDASTKKATMQRLARLVDEELVSRQEYDNSVNIFTAARQDLELARIALEKSTVRTPVAGHLDRRFVERGEYLKAGDPVALVVQVDRLKAIIDVPEKDVDAFYVGETVQVVQARIDDGPEISRAGQLLHLAYKADPRTRTYRGKIEIDNRDGALRPGMIIRVEALRRQLRDVVAIPLYAVVDLDGRKVVFIAADGRAELHPVSIDRVVGDLAVLGAGLAAGDRLIVKGQQMLTDGAAIKVQSAAP